MLYWWYYNDRGNFVTAFLSSFKPLRNFECNKNATNAATNAAINTATNAPTNTATNADNARKCL